MKRILNVKTAYTLFFLGLIMIYTGLLLKINNLNNQISELRDFVDIQGKQINKCNAENSSLYKNYIELEEKNMILEAQKKKYEKEKNE